MYCNIYFVLCDSLKWLRFQSIMHFLWSITINVFTFWICFPLFNYNKCFSSMGSAFTHSSSNENLINPWNSSGSLSIVIMDKHALKLGLHRNLCPPTCNVHKYMHLSLYKVEQVDTWRPTWKFYVLHDVLCL